MSSSIPPLPPGAALVEAPASKTSIVKRSFKRKPEPWMIPLVERLAREMMPIRQIPGYLGTTYAMMTAWRNAGEEEGCSDPLLVEFALAFAKGRAEMTETAVSLLKGHAMTDFRAAVELLKAADPETWSPKSTVKIEAEISPKSAIDLTKLTAAELDAYEALSEKARRDG